MEPAGAHSDASHMIGDYPASHFQRSNFKSQRVFQFHSLRGQYAAATAFCALRPGTDNGSLVTQGTFKQELTKSDNLGKSHPELDPENWAKSQGRASGQLLPQGITSHLP